MEVAKKWGYTVEERKVAVKEIIEAIENGTLTEAFGLGTAATVAHIDTIAFRDQNYKLPAIEGREFSNKVSQYLMDYKKGLEQDVFGWNLVI